MKRTPKTVAVTAAPTIKPHPFSGCRASYQGRGGLPVSVLSVQRFDVDAEITKWRNELQRKCVFTEGSDGSVVIESLRAETHEHKARSYAGELAYWLCMRLLRGDLATLYGDDHCIWPLWACGAWAQHHSGLQGEDAHEDPRATDEGKEKIERRNEPLPEAFCKLFSQLPESVKTFKPNRANIVMASMLVATFLQREGKMKPKQYTNYIMAALELSNREERDIRSLWRATAEAHNSDKGASADRMWPRGPYAKPHGKREKRVKSDVG